jgi:hypothetical protein
VAKAALDGFFCYSQSQTDPYQEMIFDSDDAFGVLMVCKLKDSYHNEEKGIPNHIHVCHIEKGNADGEQNFQKFTPLYGSHHTRNRAGRLF